MEEDKLTTEEVIKRINKGDKTVLEEVSRWKVEAMFKAGKLRSAPMEIIPELLHLLDSCKSSL